MERAENLKDFLIQEYCDDFYVSEKGEDPGGKKLKQVLFRFSHEVRDEGIDAKQLESMTMQMLKAKSELEKERHSKMLLGKASDLNKLSAEVLWKDLQKERQLADELANQLQILFKVINNQETYIESDMGSKTMPSIYNSDLVNKALEAHEKARDK